MKKWAKKWTVRADSTTTFEAQIEAYTEEEAWKIARNLDSAMFSSLENADWVVYDVFETN
jgi:hypothetical protein